MVNKEVLLSLSSAATFKICANTGTAPASSRYNLFLST